MENFEIIFYDKKDGSEPAKDFLLNLDNKMRAKVGTDISGVLYFFIIGHKIVLTNGFIKKTQKTPKEELEKAKKYRLEYLSREENDR